MTSAGPNDDDRDGSTSVAAGAPGMDPVVVRDWLEVSVQRLVDARAEINDLNVFPIPDSDTGSNMVHTMSAAARAASEVAVDASAAAVLRACADAAVGAARGNSGIILSQVLVGLADAAEINAADGGLTFNRLWAAGLGLSALAATRAVSEPREGTVLTLLRTAAAIAARDVDASPGDLARDVADACADALDRTPDLLPELAAAGVVDAGGRGLLVLLDAMVAVLTGASVRRRRYAGAFAGGDGGVHTRSEPSRTAPAGAGGGSADVVAGAETATDADTATEAHAAAHGVTGTTDYEVMYTIGAAEAGRVPGLRATLDGLGDAVVIVGDSSDAAGERFSVHVHTDEPGAAVEAGIAVGDVSDIRISCFVLDAHRARSGTDESPPSRRRAVVAVVIGDGAAELFQDEGAYVVRADDGANSADVARAVVDVDAAHVVVLGNGAIAVQELVAVAADAHSAHRVVVFLPTSSMVQGLAALAVHDVAAAPDADAYAMAEAVAATRWGSVTVATEPALTLAGATEVGNLLGLIGNDVLVIGRTEIETTTALLDLMLSTGGELVTVLAGADVDDHILDAVHAHVAHAYPGVEFMAYRAGHAGDVVQVGVE